MRNKALLLPFGKALASTYHTGAEFLAALQRYQRPVTAFDFTSVHHGGSVVGLRIGALGATATCSESFRAAFEVAPQVAFILPVLGSGRITCRGSALEWRANKTVIRTSYHDHLEVAASASAAVTLCPSTEKLAAALRGAMDDSRAGAAAQAEKIAAGLLERGPVVDTGKSWSMDYFAGLMKLAAIVDDCACDEALLARIGLEDVFNRLLARLLLEQEQGASRDDHSQHQPRSTRAVDTICERIRSTIGSPLSISEMEELTGLTGRALNYAFRARFGCSPQEWQRNFLLDHARQLLTGTLYSGSVKSLSYDLGFSSPSSFAAHYRQRFGERPSASRNGGPEDSAFHASSG